MKEKVIHLIKDIALCDIDNPARLLSEDLKIDSLGLVTLLIMLEESLGIELDEADMDPFKLLTVDDVISLAEKYKNKNGDDENEK